VTGKDQPALDGVYKLSAIRDPGQKWKYKLKLSEQMHKISNPGILQIRRFFSNENVADVIYDINNGIEDGCTMVDPLDGTRQKLIKKGLSSRDLLVPIFRKGNCVYSQPTLQEIQKKTKIELQQFPVGIKRFLNPHLYEVGLEKSLYDEKINLVNHIRQHATQESIVPREE
jgi:nicotinate phosphoribosyltransferase